MIEQNELPVRAWNTTLTQKEKNAMQRSVTAIVATLAPERVPRRSEEVKQRIDHHRTPRGCILQASNAALSVSWFSDTRVENFGELQVSVWDGVISRGGASYRKPAQATLVSEVVLRPADVAAETMCWRDESGREFDTAGLVALCRQLLETQIERSA